MTNFVKPLFSSFRLSPYLYWPFWSFCFTFTFNSDGIAVVHSVQTENCPPWIHLRQRARAARRSLSKQGRAMSRAGPDEFLRLPDRVGQVLLGSVQL